MLRNIVKGGGGGGGGITEYFDVSSVEKQQMYQDFHTDGKR